MSYEIVHTVKIKCDNCGLSIDPGSNYQRIEGFETEDGLQSSFWFGNSSNVRAYEALHFCNDLCMLQWMRQNISE